MLLKYLISNKNHGRLRNNHFMQLFTVLYSGNVWQGESLTNLVNEHNFAKLKLSKRHMHVTKQWDCTPIHQTFFAKSFIKSISPNIITAKHSRYTVTCKQKAKHCSGQ